MEKILKLGKKAIPYNATIFRNLISTVEPKAIAAFFKLFMVRFFPDSIR